MISSEFFFIYFKIPIFIYFLNISYLFGIDIFSYLMVTLGIWIIRLVYIFVFLEIILFRCIFFMRLI